MDVFVYLLNEKESAKYWERSKEFQHEVEIIMTRIFGSYDLIIVEIFEL